MPSTCIRMKASRWPMLPVPPRPVRTGTFMFVGQVPAENAGARRSRAASASRTRSDSGREVGCDDSMAVTTGFTRTVSSGGGRTRVGDDSGANVTA